MGRIILNLELLMNFSTQLDDVFSKILRICMQLEDSIKQDSDYYYLNTTIELIFLKRSSNY